MRLVQILAMDPGVVDPIVDALDEEGLDYGITDHTEGQASSVLSLPVPADAVEPTIDRLSMLGIDEDIYTVVHDVEAVVSERFNQLQPDTGEVSPTHSERISRDELRSTARELLPSYGLYSVLTAVGAVVATAGFLLDSLAVVIGAMVIAPLFGPPMAASVATVTGDSELLADSTKLQIVGSAVGVVSATGLAALVRLTPLGSSALDVQSVLEVSSFGSSTLLLLVVALAAGIAGAIGLSSDDSTVLTQVMLASAIVPPIGVTGIAVAWLLPTLALGALAVMVVNLLAVELTAILALWYQGYHPDDWAQLRATRGTILKMVLLLGGGIALVVFLLVELSGGSVVVLGGWQP